jgi:hypothetical protein
MVFKPLVTTAGDPLYRMTLLKALAFLCFAPCGTSGQQGAPALPPFPPDVPADAMIHYSMINGTPQAQQAVWRDTAGTRHIVFMQNLPSCQVRIRSAIVTDAAGLPVSIRTEGTTCGPPRNADEEFGRAGGLVRWQNRVERGDTLTADPRYYFSLADLPEESALLARALIAAGGALPLWPAGAASIEHLQDLAIGAVDSLRASGNTE